MRGSPGTRGVALYAVVSLLAGVLFVLLARWYTGAPWSLPLDDPFIYLQYARQTAAGHPFVYNTGDPPTTGATSPLYVLLLVPGFWLGLDGLRMVPYVLLIGVASLAWTAILAHRLAARWLGPRWGTWTGALILTCGPLVWGALSGMELGLFLALLLWLLDVADRAFDGQRRARGLVVPAVLVAAWRPEGLLLVATLLVVAAIRARGGQAARSGAGLADLDLDRSRGGVAPSARAVLPPLLLGVAAGCLPAAAFALAGAGWMPAGVAAKSLWAAQPLELPEVLRQVAVTAVEILKGIFGGSLGDRTSARLVAYDMNARAQFFAPLTLTLWVLGVLPAVAAELGARRPGRATVLAGWCAVLLVATASLVEPDAHFNRYQAPIMPLFLLGAVAGAVRAGRWARLAVGGRAASHLTPALLGLLLAFGIVTSLAFAVHYGDNAGDIQAMQVRMARVIDTRLPADARVAINDAGILRYLSHRRTLDLVGLTSPGMARIWRDGSGSLIEALETMPEAARPTHFAIFPNWFRLAESELLVPRHAVRLLTPSIVDAEMVLYDVDWSVVRADDAPCHGTALPPGHQVVDALDVADLDDEARHACRRWAAERGGGAASVAVLGRCAAAGNDSLRRFVDGGRLITGGLELRCDVTPGRDVGIVMRTRGGAATRLAVAWNGVPLATPELRGAVGTWIEQPVARVPAVLVDGPTATVRLEPAADDGRPLLVCQLWITQPPAGERWR
jgi:hypothetical protein